MTPEETDFVKRAPEHGEEAVKVYKKHLHNKTEQVRRELRAVVEGPLNSCTRKVTRNHVVVFPPS